MAVLDLDKNGCNDLVISAPTEGSDLLEYGVSPILWRKIYSTMISVEINKKNFETGVNNAKVYV